MGKGNWVVMAFLAAFLLAGLPQAEGAIVLLTERNASTVWEWEIGQPTGTIFRSVRSNDADYNPSQGSPDAWIAEHFSDYFGSFDPSSGSGLDNQYDLGSGGRTHYAYPKHVSVYNNNVIVMSRNDATIYRYDFAGNQLGSIATGNGTGQGLATDGTSLYASFWSGGNSFFERYDASFVWQETIANPSGMDPFTNIVDFIYDPDTGHYFGLATDYEQGTLTQSNTVLEFLMGGAVLSQYTVGIMADGIGVLAPTYDGAQVPEPATLALLGLAVGGLAAYRRKRK